VLWRLKRYQDALATYDRTLAIDPKFAQVLHNKALSLRALGRNAEAKEAERRVKALGG
jgi:tetratricopeptide (TPR) repeat protein